MQFLVPDSGIGGGNIFGYGPDLPNNTTWSKYSGTFALSTTGGAIFLYCYDANGDSRPLVALSYNGNFSQPGLPSYSITHSALPESLKQDGAIILPPMANYKYSGPSTGDATQLQKNIVNASMWVGSNSERFYIKGTQPPPPSRGSTVRHGILMSLLVGILGNILL